MNATQQPLWRLQSTLKPRWPILKIVCLLSGCVQRFSVGPPFEAFYRGSWCGMRMHEINRKVFAALYRQNIDKCSLNYSSPLTSGGPSETLCASFPSSAAASFLSEDATTKVGPTNPPTWLSSRYHHHREVNRVVLFSDRILFPVHHSSLVLLVLLSSV